MADPNYLIDNQIRIFDGVGGPELDPVLIDWTQRRLTATSSVRSRARTIRWAS